jgi:DNA-binding LacI/PurR family transcriptional regulator
MIAPRLGSNELARYAGKLPVVSLLRNDVGESVDAISSDDHAGVRMSVQHLVDLGHRKVIHVDGGTAVSAALRRDAFQVEMRRHGLEPVVIPGGESEEDGLKAGYLLQQCAPTAVLAFNDRSALGVMESFRAAGLRVPEDVSVIGFDNSQLAALSFVQLSSVSPEAPQLAAAAVDQAINRVEGNEVPSHVVRTPRLVLRRTIARPRLVTTPLN